MRYRARHIEFRLALLVGSCLAAFSSPPALAGRPIPGDRYFGFPAGASEESGFVDATGELRVSVSGRSAKPASLNFYCPGGTATASGVARRGIRIRRDGSFATEERRSQSRYRALYRLQGRFVTNDLARITYTERRLRTRRLTCRSRMKLYRNGVPPFSGCRSQRATTILSGETGRVFLQYAARHPGSGGEFRLGSFFPHLYACLFDAPSKRTEFGENYAPDDERENFRLAGPYLAFFRYGCAMCIWPQRWIEVRDIRDGSLAHDPSVPWGSRPADLELKPNGSLAWSLDRVAIGPDGLPIDYGSGQPPAAVAWEVWALDSQGQRLLDSGPSLDLQSLELNESILTWINNGTAHSATLD